MIDPNRYARWSPPRTQCNNSAAASAAERAATKREIKREMNRDMDASIEAEMAHHRPKGKT